MAKVVILLLICTTDIFVFTFAYDNVKATIQNDLGNLERDCEFVQDENGCSNLLNCARLCKATHACEYIRYEGKEIKVN